MKIFLLLLCFNLAVYAQDVVKIEPSGVSFQSPTGKHFEKLKPYIHVKTQFVKTGETYSRKRTNDKGYYKVFVNNDSNIPIKNLFIEFNHDGTYSKGNICADTWIMPKQTGSGTIGENSSDYIASYNLRFFEVNQKDLSKILKLK